MISETIQYHAIEQFRKHGGMLRTKEALRLGIHPRTLYALYDAGQLQQFSRGLYRLTDLPPLSTPDWVIVARRIPSAILCLVSALAFHELTTQIPHFVDIAMKQGTQKPTLGYPPLRVFWFSARSCQEGVETHTIDDTPIRIFGAAKSVADVFKYRHKIGLDIALEALRLYRRRADFRVDTFMHFARINRVDRIVRPHVETLL